MHRNETLTPHINGSTIACRYNQIIQLKIFRLQKYWSNHLEGFRHLTIRIFKIVEDTFPMAFHGSAQLGYKTWLMDGRFANACFQRKKAIFTSLSKSRFFSWVTCSVKIPGAENSLAIIRIIYAQISWLCHVNPIVNRVYFHIEHFYEVSKNIYFETRILFENVIISFVRNFQKKNTRFDRSVFPVGYYYRSQIKK